MRQTTIVRLCFGATAMSVVLLAGCRDNPLDVKNTQQPSVGGVFSSPLTVETAVSKLFEQLYNGQLGASDDIMTQTITMSFESASQLGNFGMGTRGGWYRAYGLKRTLIRQGLPARAAGSGSAGSNLALLAGIGIPGALALTGAAFVLRRRKA